MSDPVAFGGSYLIGGTLYTSYLYDIGDDSWGWELVATDSQGSRSVSYVRGEHPDVNCALLWVLGRVLEFALSEGVEPDQLPIIQQSYCPDSNPEFIATVLRVAYEGRHEVRH